MTNQELFELVQYACEQIFRPFVPYTPVGHKNDHGGFTPASTGNERFNATKCVKVSENESQIRVDGGSGDSKKGDVESKTAPYAVYTNEPWISEKWHGLKNPNEGWFERATRAVAEYLAKKLGGTLSVGTSMDDTKDIAFEQYRTERSAWDDNFNNYYQGRYRK